MRMVGTEATAKQAAAPPATDGPASSARSSTSPAGRSVRAKRPSAPTTAAAPADNLNEVRLVGRLGGEVRETTMPSGDTMIRFHVIVERSAKARRDRPRAPAVDALGCTAWTAGARKTLAAARAGDMVEVTGALRRRFQRGAASPTSWYDVEVQKIKRRATRSG